MRNSCGLLYLIIYVDENSNQQIGYPLDSPNLNNSFEYDYDLSEIDVGGRNLEQFVELTDDERKSLDHSKVPFIISIRTEDGFRKIKIPCDRIIGTFNKTPKEYANPGDLDKNDSIVPTMDPFDIVKRWNQFNCNDTIRVNKRIKLEEVMN